MISVRSGTEDTAKVNGIFAVSTLIKINQTVTSTSNVQIDQKRMDPFEMEGVGCSDSTIHAEGFQAVRFVSALRVDLCLLVELVALPVWVAVE